MFGASNSSQQNSGNGISDLLLGGAGGFAGSSSLGNGFNSAVANDTSSSSGAANMAPGGTANGTSSSGASNTTFDLNDFPSLGGTVVMQGSSNSDNNNSGVSAALRDQQ